MIAPSTADFDRHYQTHLECRRRKGLQPKTIDADARAIRRIGARATVRFNAGLHDPAIFAGGVTRYLTAESP